MVQSRLPIVGLPAFSLTQMLMLLAELLLAFIIGLGLLLLGADGTSWILGGIAAGAIVFVMSHAWFKVDATPNRNARKTGQLLVGLTVGFSVQHNHAVAIASHIPLFILLIGCLLLSGIGVAALYVYLEKTDWLTAILATTPGNIGVMASIAAEYGGNPTIVSLVQLGRFTAVTLAIPLLSKVSHRHDVWGSLAALTPHLTDANVMYLARLTFVLLFAGLSVKLGETLKLPVPGLLCPLLVGIGFNAGVDTIPFLSFVDFNPPALMNLLGQILLGITIGEYWGMNPNLGHWTIARAIVPAGLTLLAGLGVAAIAKLLTSWSWLTCLLVTAPGGSPEMIWIALTLNQDVELVTAGHLVRLIAINALLPAIVALAAHLGQKETIKIQ